MLETSGETIIRQEQVPPIKKKKETWKDQKNMLQMKEQGKNTQDLINEEEIGNIP